MIVIKRQNQYLLSERSPAEGETEVNILDFTSIYEAISRGDIDEQKYGELLREKLIAEGYTLAPSPTGKDFASFITQNPIPLSTPYFVYPTQVFAIFSDGGKELAKYLKKLAESRQNRKFLLFSYIFMGGVDIPQLVLLEQRLQSTPLGDIYNHHIETGRVGKINGEPNDGILDFLYSTAGSIFETNGAASLGISATQIQALSDIIVHGSLVERA